MSKRQMIPDPVLNEIFEKALRCSEMVDFGLSENSIAYLINEEINQADIDTVQNSLDVAKKGMDAYDKYIDKLGIDKAKLKTGEKYIGKLRDALDTAQGQLASASLESGALSSFFGQEVTLPQITQAAIALHTKANDFMTALGRSFTLIQDQLGPLIKDEDAKKKPLRDVAGTGGIPEADKLQQGFQKALHKSMGGGAWNRMKRFLGQSVTGPEKKIMAQLPKIVPETQAAELAKALMDATFEELSLKPPDLDDPPGGLKKVGQKSVDEEQADGPPAGDKAPAEKDMSPEDAAAADKEAKKVAAAVGKGPLSKDELAQILKKYPDIIATGKTGNKARRVFRQAINQAAGTTVFEEQVAMLKRPALVEVLLGSKRAPLTLRTEDGDDATFSEHSRWSELAGLEKK